ncbi:hypothetical protein [Eleftheria terrae]|uniref:hypothetical protein n=1 Tax=Eleftheria terrae TaxID=1597781 RepID=UPI00263A9C06|nr:hypothetical protein [Eleftheria terrae]WKB51499.1 hypothetical protein N7L95_17045 [Eleftheria terrae]
MTLPGHPFLLMNETTIPFGEPELMRASVFQRYLDELARQPGATTALPRLTALSPSLLADLQRFEHRPSGTEVLEVLAACLRHAQSVVVHCEAGGYVVPVTVFPRERLFHCPAEPDTYLLQRLALLKVLRIEPAVLRAPGNDEASLVAPLSCYHPIAPLLWDLAMRGSRTELLPEIAGNACYRTTPGLDLRMLPLTAAQRAVVRHMRTQPVTLRELSDLIGQGREHAVRLLNALYLQSGLIISRALPSSSAESWLANLGLRRRHG